MGVLKKRYAKGEISEGEFKEMKKELRWVGCVKLIT